ncbi:MAG TPA: universal stress protein [Chloroflexota bacterium]|nr:universal stress protein [Chloroflexota bacterium]
MHQRILVTLDGSEPAEAALSYAEALARGSRGALCLVQAAPPDEQAATSDYLHRLAADLRARGVAAAARVLDGAPADAVAAAATEWQADLIVMASHGRTGLERSLQGSVADAVLHRAAVPLLLVRLGHVAASSWPCRVLVPLDGSELAEAAVDHAGGLVGTDGELVLYQAVLPETSGRLGELGDEPVWAALLSDAESAAQSYLDGVAARQRAAGRRVRTVAELGEPAAGIADYCHRARVDLVVLSSHGRAGVRRWLQGSVADDLLRLAPAPLLVLRPLLEAARAPQHVTPGERPRPPATLELTARQAELLRLVLERLIHDSSTGEPLTAEVQTLVQKLYATADGPAGRAAPDGSAAAGAGDRVADDPWESWGAGPAVDRGAIQSGYPVFARPDAPADEGDLGAFVGVVDEVIDSRDAPYLHVRGGLEQAGELFLPLKAVRAAGGHQVRLSLSPADLLRRRWPAPRPAALRAV